MGNHDVAGAVIMFAGVTLWTAVVIAAAIVKQRRQRP